MTTYLLWMILGAISVVALGASLAVVASRKKKTRPQTQPVGAGQPPAPTATGTTWWEKWGKRVGSFWEKSNDLLIGLAILAFVYLVVLWFFPDIYRIVPPKLWIVAAIAITLITFTWNFFKDHTQLRRYSIMAISALLILASAKVLWDGYEHQLTAWWNKPPTAQEPSAPRLPVAAPAARQAAGVTQVPVVAGTPECPYRTEPLLVSDQKWVRINPGARCTLATQRVVGCMYFMRHEATGDCKVYGACAGVPNNLPLPPEQKVVPEQVEWVRSAEGVLTGSYQLRPAHQPAQGAPPRQTWGVTVGGDARLGGDLRVGVYTEGR